MKVYNLLKIALKSLRKNVFRTFLTMLGIIIGVAAVIAMLAIGQGSKDSIEQSISSLGSNVILVFPGSSARRGAQMGAGTSQPLKETYVKAIEENSPSVKWISPVVSVRGQLITGSSNWNTSVLGVYSSYLDIRDYRIVSGTTFTDNDVRRATKVCLIGQTVRRELFGEFADPLGKSIRINKVPFRIIGVLEEKGAGMMGGDQDDLVLAPFATVQRRLLGSTDVHQIFASAHSEEQVEPASREVEKALRKAARVKTGDELPFAIRTMSEISTMLASTSQVLMVLLASIAGISLVVGGIGIMNIMYVTVTERTREVGLRMAVGAKGRDILFQFLTEAVFISITGGLIGVLLGVTVSFLFGNLMDWPVTVTTFSILLAFGCSSLIGIFFGWYPAKKAAGLVPIAALRYE